MAIIRLKPSFQHYLWGGHRLVEEYYKDYDGPVLAESWELSCHPDGPAYIADGPDAGRSLTDYLESHPGALGTACPEGRLPILIKLIDAKQDLSVQVHPDDAYALAHEGQSGKTELWYVLDCQPGAVVYHGLSRPVSRTELEGRIQDHTLVEVLNAVPVRKGSVFYIEAGTIHAIGANVLLAEIQQSSNVTYRLYDYGRKGPDGKERPLHIEKALAVADLAPPVNHSFSPHIASCPYFTVDKLELDGGILGHAGGVVGERSFLSVLLVAGEGVLSCAGQSVPCRKGDSLFLPAGSGEFRLSGTCQALLTYCT